MVTDFIYDNIRLSDLGYAVMSYDGAVNNKIDTDSQISINHVSMMGGKRQPYASVIYDDPLKMEFFIGKNNCIETTSQVEHAYSISVSEMAFLKRWLVRTTPQKLVIPVDEYNGIYWKGSFNLEEHVFGDERIGAHLTFECDAPFGYMEDVMIRGEADSDNPYYFNCTSDEIGFIYPFMEIVVGQDGDLELTNSADGRTTIIKNCTQNEVITMSDTLQISSSLPSHKICDDFNFEFYRVNSDLLNVENSVESNIPIEFTISYTPYAKAVIV